MKEKCRIGALGDELGYGANATPPGRAGATARRVVAGTRRHVRVHDVQPFLGEAQNFLLGEGTRRRCCRAAQRHGGKNGRLVNCQRQVGPEMDESEDDDEAGRELSVLSVFDKESWRCGEPR